MPKRLNVHCQGGKGEVTEVEDREAWRRSRPRETCKSDDGMPRDGNLPATPPGHRVRESHARDFSELGCCSLCWCDAGARAPPATQRGTLGLCALAAIVSDCTRLHCGRQRPSATRGGRLRDQATQENRMEAPAKCARTVGALASTRSNYFPGTNVQRSPYDQRQRRWARFL